ncbi:orotate phosphoribosyltransferase [Deinococcus koreensis]|uniref:Orotate phosphoribosyltransferase n=1 Tax=Deinococcus koreensis TaxID=2054903 RepID=A0A2K3V2G2_9DEIO|nr:orotate phosphoribosyltransferase [Deinococcus koreensis]
MRDPLRLDEVARVQAEQIGRVWPQATLLVGLPECGAVLSAFVARHLGLPVAFVHSSGVPGWHRMHVPERAERAVIVDDLIGTGRGVRVAADFLIREGHAVLGVSAWISRAEPGALKVLTLMPPPYPTWKAEGCPDCSAGYAPRYTGIRE